MYLVGCILEIYYDARSYKRQNWPLTSRTTKSINSKEKNYTVLYNIIQRSRHLTVIYPFTFVKFSVLLHTGPELAAWIQTTRGYSPKECICWSITIDHTHTHTHTSNCRRKSNLFWQPWNDVKHKRWCNGKALGFCSGASVSYLAWTIAYPG